MDLKEIRELLELVDQTNAVEEFEMEQADLRIRIRKAAATNASSVVIEQSGSAPERLAPGGTAQQAPSDSFHVFKAPIVGTFYITPKPDADPFVRVGDVVHKGMVLCIIEAMKLFNQIESDVDGTIVRILVENGQPVEYGQPLFVID